MWERIRTSISRTVGLLSWVLADCHLESLSCGQLLFILLLESGDESWNAELAIPTEGALRFFCRGCRCLGVFVPLSAIAAHASVDAPLVLLGCCFLLWPGHRSQKLNCSSLATQKNNQEGTSSAQNSRLGRELRLSGLATRKCPNFEEVLHWLQELVHSEPELHGEGSSCVLHTCMQLHQYSTFCPPQMLSASTPPHAPYSYSCPQLDGHLLSMRPEYEEMSSLDVHSSMKRL